MENVEQEIYLWTLIKMADCFEATASCRYASVCMLYDLWNSVAENTNA